MQKKIRNSVTGFADRVIDDYRTHDTSSKSVNLANRDNCSVAVTYSREHRGYTYKFDLTARTELDQGGYLDSGAAHGLTVIMTREGKGRQLRYELDLNKVSGTQDWTLHAEESGTKNWQFDGSTADGSMGPNQVNGALEVVGGISDAALDGNFPQRL